MVLNATFNNMSFYPFFLVETIDWLVFNAKVN